MAVHGGGFCECCRVFEQVQSRLPIPFVHAYRGHDFVRAEDPPFVGPGLPPSSNLLAHLGCFFETTVVQEYHCMVEPERLPVGVSPGP